MTRAAICSWRGRRDIRLLEVLDSLTDCCPSDMQPSELDGKPLDQALWESAGRAPHGGKQPRAGALCPREPPSGPDDLRTSAEDQ